MEGTCKLFFCGDVVITHKHQLDELFSDEIQHLIEDHDIACCNFEAPVIAPDSKKLNKVGPSLYQDDSSISILEEAGFNLMNLANNHIMDYGISGLNKTIDSIRKAAYIGADSNYERAYAHIEKEINGIKVCFMSVAENGFGAATDNNGGYAWFGNPEFTENIKKNKLNADYLVIMCHAGAENWDHPLPEIRKLYKHWVDLGADLIIAHHPHVAQGWENYKNAMIYYSLGNFYFEPQIGEIHTDTIGVSVEIFKNKDPQFNIHYFKKKGIQLTMEESNKFKLHLRECCEILDFNRYDEYLKSIDELCDKSYNRMYKSYYDRVLGIYTGGLLASLKSFIRRWLLREKFSNLWLYHNITIETHLWICQRALKNIINNKINNFYEKGNL
jgi:hypothetical protein